MISTVAKRKNRPPVPSTPQPASRRVWIMAALVAVFAGSLYLGTLRAGFIWDDHNLIEMNAARASASDFYRLWVSDFWQTDRTQNRSEYYRPLTSTSFLLDRLLYQARAWGYHLTNLLLYALTCGLAYLLLYKLLPDPVLAFLLALLFAALPAHTENVAWVSGRTDLVCAALMFASLLFYLRADQTGRPGLWAAAAVLFFLSLCGKEMSVSLVAVVFVHQAWFHGSLRRALLRTLPYAAVAAVFAILHTRAAPHVASENIYTTPPAYLLNALRNLVLGLWYSLVPGGFHYLVAATREEAAQNFPLPAGLPLLGVVILGAAAVAGVALAVWKKEKLLGFSLAAGLLSLLPICGIIPLGVIFALRLLFIPSFFLVLFAGTCLEKIAGRPWRIGPQAVSPGAILMVPIIVLYAAITLLRVPEWQDDAALMRSALKQAPHAALAHFLLGNALASQGQEAEAIRQYEQALDERAGYAEVEFNLGVLEQRSGRLDQAEQRFRAALAHKPEFRPAWVALVRLLQSQGREAEAMELLRARPISTPPH